MRHLGQSHWCISGPLSVDLLPLAKGIQRRQWHPTPVLLPGKSHGRRSMVGCSPWSLRVGQTERLHFHFHALEKEMATHSSVLTWRIPGTGEPGGLPSMGSQSQTRLKRLSSSSSSQRRWALESAFQGGREENDQWVNRHQRKGGGKHFLLGHAFVPFINDCSGQLHKSPFFKGQVYFIFLRIVLNFSYSLICGQLELLY